MRGSPAWLVLAALALAPEALAQEATPDQEAVDQEAPADAAVERKQEQDSLLFSRQVQDLIEAARQARGTTTSAAPGDAEAAPLMAGPATVHLSAILYEGPGDWQIWLNGRSFEQSGVAGATEILGVRQGSVQLRWRGAQARPVDIILRPNQTYIVGTGEIVEGPPERAWRTPGPAPQQPVGSAATRSQ
jgi:hypothetical protein